MADEIKEEKVIISKEYKCFLLNILGSFLGCLVALCLFSAAVKPQTPPPIPCHCQKMMHHKQFPGDFKGNKMHKNFEGKKFDKQVPPEFQKPPVKPEK